MLFSSIPFLYYFLACVMIMYFIVPGKIKNIVLLLSSLFFYAWGEVSYVALMVITITLGYVFGLIVDRCNTDKSKKCVLTISVITFVGILGYFKYADFFVSNFNAATGMSVPLLRVALPIGISFTRSRL